MTLPKRPPLNNPIPNPDIPNTPRQYLVKAPYWNAVVSGDLTVTEDGVLALEGATFGGNSDVEVQGAYWNMPIGDGLYIGANGSLTTQEPSPYIYCTPAYPELPVTYPPYECNTEVNTAGVTDFTEAWYNCQDLTEFPCVDSSSVTDFSYAWEYCYGLTSFSSINTSTGENFTYSWAYTGLTSFPEINTSNGSIFYGTWCGCYYLEEFPELDLSKGEDFTYAWYNCESLTTFPLLNVSSGTNFRSAWAYCISLTSFPLLDVSSGTNFRNAWYDCESLTSFPLLNVSSGTNFSSSWAVCTSLTTFPALDLSSGTDFYYAWGNCTGLTSFPALDLSSGTYFGGAWYNCNSLTTFPAGMFDSCSATNFSSWQNCALSEESVDNILVSLDTAGQSGGIVSIDGGTSAAPGSAGLTAKASLEGKGWTVITN